MSHTAPSLKEPNTTPSSSTDSLPLLPMHESHAQPRLPRTTPYQWRPPLLTVISTPVKGFVDRNKGLLLIGGSQFFMSGMTCIVKLMSSRENELDGVADESRVHVPTFELIAIRMALTGILSVLSKDSAPYTGPPGIRHLLIIRGVVGFLGLFGLYYSLQYLSLSDSTIITFLSPFVTALAGWLILRESFSLREGMAGLASLVGVILIARPTFLFSSYSHPEHVASPSINGLASANSTSHNSLIGDGVLGDSTVSISTHSDKMRLVAVGVALLGVCGVAGAFISLRKIGQKAHALHIISYFCAWSVVVSTVASFATGAQWILPPDWVWVVGLLAIGILGFSAQIGITLGFRYESAGRGSLALYVQIIFALALERIVFKVRPPLLSVIGMVVIISSAIFIVLSKPSESSTSQKQPRTHGSLIPDTFSDAALEGSAETAQLMSIRHGESDEQRYNEPARHFSRDEAQTSSSPTET